MELIELILQRYKSEHTQRQYRKLLEELRRFMGWSDLSELSNISRKDAMHFIRHVRALKGQKGRKLGQDEKVCESTVKRKHTILRAIFRELKNNGEVPENPFEFPMIVAERKPEKRPTEAVPFNYVLKICDGPSPFTQKGIQDRAMLAMLFGNGGRRGELTQLRIGHMKPRQDGSLSYDVLRTKGGSLRTKYLPQWASERVLWHIKYREARGATPESWLFVGPSGELISDATVYKRFKYWVEAAGLDPKMYSPHSARATMATLLHGEGLSTREIMEVGGWECPQMVERYVKLNFDEEEHPAKRVDFSKF